MADVTIEGVNETGSTQKIGAHLGRLNVDSITNTETQAAVHEGTAFNINTGLITSISSDSALIYIKNNETKPLVIDAVAAHMGNVSVAGSDSSYLYARFNPTAGDIISDATDVSIKVSRKVGATFPLPNSVAYQGKNGGTMTGATDAAIFGLSGEGRVYLGVDFEVPPGNSFGLWLDQATGGMTIDTMYVALIGHLKR